MAPCGVVFQLLDTTGTVEDNGNQLDTTADTAIQWDIAVHTANWLDGTTDSNVNLTTTRAIF